MIRATTSHNDTTACRSRVGLYTAVACDASNAAWANCGDAADTNHDGRVGAGDSGQCACHGGFADCDHNAANGCEVDITTDTTNCSTCGHVCAAPTGGSATCSVGLCGESCPDGTLLCGAGVDGAGTCLPCAPPDQCHQGPPACDGTGGCAYASVADDTPCTEGGNFCVAGACTQLPTLASLTVSPLTLAPTFLPATHDYAVLCSAATNTLTLDIAAVPGGSVSLTAPVTTSWVPTDSQTVQLAEDQAAVVLARDANGVTEQYWIRCLPHDFPLVSASKHPEVGSPTPGWYLIGNVFVAFGSGRFAMIVDENGTPVWYHRTATAPTVVTPLPDSTIGITTLAAPSAGTLYHLNSWTTEPVQTVGIPLDDHELKLAPNGDLMLLSYPTLTGVNLAGLKSYTCTDCTISDCAVQEIDPQGNLVWDWRASDHTDPVHESVVPSGAGTTLSPADVYHCNAIDVNADGDVLVSFRHMDAVLLISRTTGDVVWKVGGTPFNKDGARILTIQDDPEGTISGQHDARFQANGDITVFDDHTAFAGTGITGPARGLEYALDLDGGTARLVWQYQGPASSGALGSFRRFTDGTSLVGWGNSTGAANLICSEVNATGQDLLDMFFTTRGNWSYRAEKVPIEAFDVEVLRNTAGLP